MYSYKSSSYEQMETKPKEKKFKQNAYEEVRKLIEENEDNNSMIKKIKNKKKTKKENQYNFKLFD